MYLELLSHALKIFNDFNTNLQSEIPLLHTLILEVERLTKNVAKNYIESSYMEDVDPLDLDPLNGEMYLPIHEVYLGKASNLFMEAFNLLLIFSNFQV